MTKSVAGLVQEKLARFYRLDDLPRVEDFARTASRGGREQVLVREAGDAVEIAVVLPDEGFFPAGTPLAVDVTCQIVEGVSHFVYLVERVRTGLPATQLELELQAEVDKFVVLGLPALATRDHETARTIHARLYENVRYLHDEASERGERYRVANDLAARLCARLGARVTKKLSLDGAIAYLRSFYGKGQTEKIRLATAA